MANVLLISYLFPPSGGVGISRAISYTRYLPLRGCRVFVVTARRPATPLYDPDLLDRVPAETQVYRCFNPEVPYGLRDAIWRRLSPPHRLGGASSPATDSAPSRNGVKTAIRRAIENALFPDVQSTWVPFALRTAERIIEREGIDAVLLNIPPYSIFKIAVELRRKYPKLKIVTDVRDDWLGYYLMQFDSADVRRIQRARTLERAAVEASTYVSIVTPRWVEELRARYPDQPPDKFIYTPNGYEPQDFKDFVPRQHGGDKMVVTYFGSVYMSKPYSPAPYLDAVDNLAEDIRSRIETRFIGRVTSEAQPFLNDRKSVVRQFGFMPKAKGIQFLEETDCLLLTAMDPAVHAGKLLEYLATGKPILAISPPDGEVAKVLRETRSGWCADARDRSGIERMLSTAYQTVREKGTEGVNPNWNAINSYSWPEIVARLAKATGIGNESSEA